MLAGRFAAWVVTILLMSVDGLALAAGAPQLTSERLASGRLRLSWSTTGAASARLETTDALGPAAVWRAASETVVAGGASSSVEVAILEGRPRYFRLRLDAAPAARIAEVSPALGETGVSSRRVSWGAA